MDHPPGPSQQDPSGSNHRGLGAVKLPKLPTKKNMVSPCSEDMLHLYTDDIDHLPYSAASIDDTTDNKPFLNRKTDSEVLIDTTLLGSVKEETQPSTSSYDVPTVTVEDESQLLASHSYHGKTTLDVATGKETKRSKSIEGRTRKELGAVKPPKLPTKKNIVSPCSEDMLHLYTDDIDHLPYSAASIDDTTDNKPFLNRKTDSEVLIGTTLLGSTSSDDVPTVTVEDESQLLASQSDHGETTLDVEADKETEWSKSIQGRTRKGFGTKEHKANIPPVADRDGIHEKKSRSGEHGEGLTESGILKDKSFVRRRIWTMLSPTDSRLSMKLFGSRKGIQKEKRRLKAAGNLIIHPCSKFRFYWDLIMLFLIVFNILALPVVITFFKQGDLSLSWILFNCFMDTLFMSDVVFNFRTGFMDNQSSERVILTPKKIAIHYLKTWFVVDFVSSIPMDYIFLMFDDNSRSSHIYEVSTALKFLRFMKLLSLIRLLRLSRLLRFVGQYEQVFNVASAVIRIWNLIMIMLLIGHWNGCLQFLVPVIQDFPPYSWVAINRLQNAPFWDQYSWSLFKAMSHMLCIGYGRFPPQCVSDVWLTMVSMISGATCFALFIGHATNLIQSMDSSSRQYREKVKQVEEYLSYHKLPREMRLKITDYYEYRYHGKMFDESQIFNEVSQSILEDVANYNCRSLVASVPFFTDADPAFVTRTVSLLKYELFQPGDYILREGTFGDRMFFIQSGIVDVISPEGYIQTTLSDGSYFGEICLLTKLRRTASVKACSYCCLYSLSVDNFFNVLKEYPAMHKTMHEVAKVRLGRLGKESEIENLDDGLRASAQLDQTQVMFNIAPSRTAASSDSITRNAHRNVANVPHMHKQRLSIFDDPEKISRDSERMIKL
ncbi:potassium/sodium hyperpolarization-activated cyclic nucleotide-gated channel 3-like [Amphiura filiformis]|uniref:potassium/sodium hyperpolarization-activated cyclic nucleotide-gated channel 3-like n=1 Tax=Amphiura filiformis TaxID=82378 RepID=UPI003B216FFF